VNDGQLFRRKELRVLTGVRRSGKIGMMHITIRDILGSVEPKQIMYLNSEDTTFEQATLDEISGTIWSSSCRTMASIRSWMRARTRKDFGL